MKEVAKYATCNTKALNITLVIKVDWNRVAELLCADVSILTFFQYDVGVSFRSLIIKL